MKVGIRELLFLLMLIGLIGGTWYIQDKKAVERQQKREQIAKREKELMDLNRATAGIEDLGRKIEELQQAIKFFESKLPQEKEVDKILKEVWQMAEANRLQTKTIKTLKSERASHYSEQPIQMTLSGDFKGYYAFLLQLEKLPRLTRVTHLKLQKNKDGEQEMEAQMTLNIFFEPATSPVTASASAK